LAKALLVLLLKITKARPLEKQIPVHFLFGSFSTNLIFDEISFYQESASVLRLNFHYFIFRENNIFAVFLTF